MKKAFRIIGYLLLIIIELIAYLRQLKPIRNPVVKYSLTPTVK